MTGTLYGVGLGPGDPELVTVKAARVIGAADVVAYHSARHGHSIARGIAEPYLRDGQLEEHLVYPVTTETVDHPGGYAGAMEDFYTAAAARIAAHLDAGRDVALLAEGDPLFYSSYMHMHARLTERFAAVIVPGVTAVSAASPRPDRRSARAAGSSGGGAVAQDATVASSTPQRFMPSDRCNGRTAAHEPELRDRTSTPARVPTLVCSRRWAVSAPTTAGAAQAARRYGLRQRSGPWPSAAGTSTRPARSIARASTASVPTSVAASTSTTCRP